MTTPFERSNAVMAAAELLFDLLKDPRTSKALKERAHCVLRHFPTRVELEMTSEAMPDMWGKPSRP